MSLTKALVILAKYGVPADVLELLQRGNPDLRVRPGALAAVISAMPSDDDGAAANSI